MPGLIRTNAGPDQLGFVRGPAMIYIAPVQQAAPVDITGIVRLSGTSTNETQSVAITGTPTGGTFRLSLYGRQTGPIAYNATAAAVQTALEAVLGVGNLTATGGPLPTAVAVAFSGTLSGSNLPLMTVTNNLTGGTTPAVTVTETTPGSGFFDPVGLWMPLGATKNGVTPTYNNDEETFTIDQQKSPIATAPNTHTWGFTTTLAEVTLENLAIAWDMGPVTLNATPPVPEKRLGMGTPDSYTIRRLAVVHRRGSSGLIRAHFMYRTVRNPADTNLTYQSTGDQQTVPFNLTALPDELVGDQYSNVGYILDQQG